MNVYMFNSNSFNVSSFISCFDYHKSCLATRSCFFLFVFFRNISIVNVYCLCVFCAYFRTFRSFLGPAAVLCAREHACVTVRMYIAVNII